MPSTSSTGTTSAPLDRGKPSAVTTTGSQPAARWASRLSWLRIVKPVWRWRPRLLEQVQDDAIGSRLDGCVGRRGCAVASARRSRPGRRGGGAPCSARASPPLVRRNAASVAATLLRSPRAENARRRMPSTARSPGCSRIIDSRELEREVGVAGGERCLGLAHARPQAGQPATDGRCEAAHVRHRRPPGEALRSPPSRAARPAPPCAPWSARCASARPPTDRLR